ncbi:MAG TPA: class I SAM-dependent methyltransferase [Terriglobales bacterium]|nr:class I SAM-dependent methyltransferase [Terriglobales bacterium]
MSLTEALLENPLVYRLWQTPFANRKLEPVLSHNDLREVRRVLDVGCGPGTNAPHFQHAYYLGLDFNPQYIENARRRFKGNFEVADVTQYRAEPGTRFDFILVNSILHHIDDRNTDRILSHLNTLLTPDGHVHILELVTPEKPGIARKLAQMDRGKYARPLDCWRDLFSKHFETEIFEPYPLGMFGVPLWNMIYFKGRAHR